MNELEKLMIAESKKNAIDDELIKDEQQSENDKADNWQQETMDKLRFLENYKCRLEEKRSRGAFFIHTNGHGIIEVALNWEYDRSINKRKSVTRYHTDMPLKINWNYSMCGGDKSELSLEDFVKELVRRGIIKVEG